MKTPKEYYYVYYSYEEWGRGYIGSRGCKCLPEEDVKYLGSYTDKTFKPSQKIILAICENREEAIEEEIMLHEFYDVANNPHFANKAKQTSKKFYVSKQVSFENGKRTGKLAREIGLGFFSLSQEEKDKNCRKGGKKGTETAKKLNIGLYALTPEQRKENARKTNSQRWMCEETGFITNSGALTFYQKARGIDTSKRKRLP